MHQKTIRTARHQLQRMRKVLFAYRNRTMLKISRCNRINQVARKKRESQEMNEDQGVQKKLDTADCFLNHLLSPEPDPNLVIILGRFRGHDVVDVLVGESPIPFHHVFVIGIIAQDQDRSLNDAPEADVGIVVVINDVVIAAVVVVARVV